MRYLHVSVSFSGREDLLAAVEARARAEHRSTSNYICHVLSKHVQSSAPADFQLNDPAPPHGKKKSNSAMDRATEILVKGKAS